MKIHYSIIVLLVLVTMIVGLGSNWWAAQRAHYYKNRCLVDVIHNNIPRLPHWVPDIMVWGATLVFILFSPPRQWIQFIILFCLLTLLKSIIVQTTVFPTLHRQCNRPFFSPQGNCNDYMYSGHMMMVTLALLFLWRSSGLITVSTWFIFLLVTAITISAAHNHYTVDVVVAWILTTLVFFQFIPYLETVECVTTSTE